MEVEERKSKHLAQRASKREALACVARELHHAIHRLDGAVMAQRLLRRPQVLGPLVGQQRGVAEKPIGAVGCDELDLGPIKNLLNISRSTIAGNATCL